ncbi:unnamed protein product [Ascophyllum nodosum]
MGQATSSNGIVIQANGTYERLAIPWIVDRITVHDANLIRKITEHRDVDRIHGVPQHEKPWWVRAYFPTTRFQDRDDEMFVPLTSTKDPRYKERREYVERKVANGIAAKDVEKIALLLHESAPQAELERAVVNAVNCRFFNGKEVPAEIVAAAGKTCDQLPDVLKKFYFPPLYHQRKVLDYIEKNSDDHEGCPAADFSHHIGASVLLLTKAVKYLHEEDRGKTIHDIFTQDDMPMTIQTPRIAIRDTDIDGILDKPARAKWTVFVLNIRAAANETKDLLFTFGAGVDKRQCAFKFVFQSFMKDLQQELKRLEAGGGDQGTDNGGCITEGDEMKQG